MAYGGKQTTQSEGTDEFEEGSHKWEAPELQPTGLGDDQKRFNALLEGAVNLATDKQHKKREKEAKSRLQRIEVPWFSPPLHGHKFIQTKGEVPHIFIQEFWKIFWQRTERQQMDAFLERPALAQFILDTGFQFPLIKTPRTGSVQPCTITITVPDDFPTDDPYLTIDEWFKLDPRAMQTAKSGDVTRIRQVQLPVGPYKQISAPSRQGLPDLIESDLAPISPRATGQSSRSSSSNLFRAQGSWNLNDAQQYQQSNSANPYGELYQSQQHQNPILQQLYTDEKQSQQKMTQDGPPQKSKGKTQKQKQASVHYDEETLQDIMREYCMGREEAEELYREIIFETPTPSQPQEVQQQQPQQQQAQTGVDAENEQKIMAIMTEYGVEWKEASDILLAMLVSQLTPTPSTAPVITGVKGSAETGFEDPTEIQLQQIMKQQSCTREEAADWYWTSLLASMEQ